MIGTKNFFAIQLDNLSKLIIKRNVFGNRYSPRQIVVETIRKSFMEKFISSKLNSIDYIKACTTVFSFLYKNRSSFYLPMASLCQCSGSGKSKSSTTVLKTTPGFYICFRNDAKPDHETDAENKAGAFCYPESNNFSKMFMNIFKTEGNEPLYIVDTLEDQSNRP